MSQAHYSQCRESLGTYACGTVAVARVTAPNGRVRLLCKRHLDSALDSADRRDLEPKKIEWTYDAGGRICLLHRWPAVLCYDWSHHDVLERLRRTLDGPMPTSRGV